MYREQRHQAAMVLETGEKEVSAVESGASRGTGFEAEPQEAGVARGCV